MGARIEENMPFEEYQECGHLNQSILKHMGVPAKAHYLENNPPERTPAMELGTAVHCYVLDHYDKFDAKYFEYPDGIDKRTAEWKAIVAKHPGKIPAGKEVFQMGSNVMDEGRLNSLLLDKATKTEVTCLFRDNVNQLDLKARLDLYNETLGILGDLKTTRNASPEGFAAEIFKNGYHFQAAFYRRALRYFNKPVTDYILWAVENKPPYCAAAYRLLDEVLDLGDKQVEEYLKKYKECKDSGYWPAYSDLIQPIGIPTWSFKTLSEAYAD